MIRGLGAGLPAARWPSPLLLLMVVGCVGCQEPVTPYFHIVHVESLDVSGHPEVSVTVRFLTDEGELASPPSPSSLRVMVDGEEEAKGLKWLPVAGLGGSVLLVVDPSLGPALMDAQLVLYRDLLGAMKGSDRAALVLATDVFPPVLDWLAAEQAIQRLSALVGATPTQTSKRPPVRTPRARVPRKLIGEGLNRLMAVEDGLGRRVMVLPVFGAATGAGWKAVSAKAAANGAMVAVLGFARPGGLPPRARTVAPVYGFPVDLAHPLDKTGDALKELIVGGYGAIFTAQRDAHSVAAGFALRVVLPRDGWEEFRPAQMEVFPGRVFLDGLRVDGPGTCTLRARVVDAAARPLSPGRGEVYVRVGERSVLPTAVKVDDEPVVVAIAADRLGVRDGDALLKKALAEALGAMRSQDQVILIAPGGGASGRPSALDRDEAVTAVESLEFPTSRLLSGLITRLEEAKRRLADVEPGRRRGLLVISGAAPLRIAERGAGAAPRFRKLVSSLRDDGVVPVWVVMAPAPRVEQLGAELRARSGQILAVEDAKELRPAIQAGMGLTTSGTQLIFPCDDKQRSSLATQVRVSAVVRGRVALSRSGAPELGPSELP